MTTVFIALGSNLDDPASQLRRAIKQLGTMAHCRIEAVSSAYSSVAVGPGSQPSYLNAVVKMTTCLTPLKLLEGTQTIEENQGRIRTQRWGPRTLDLDILLYGQENIQTQKLQIPHPRMAERNFVLYPLAEITGGKLKLPCGSVLESLLMTCPPGDLVHTEVALDNYEAPE